MAFRATSDDACLKYVQTARAKLEALYPVTWKCAAYTARMARRRAPVGRGRFRGALKRSLNARAIGPETWVLESALPYAAIQQYGGSITAGSGPLGSRLLAIPLNDDARKLLDGLGASVSLRTQDLVLLKTRRGRLVLVRQEKPRGPRAKVRRGAGRQHRMFGGQVLFVLVPRVTLQPNPPPAGYAPRGDDPELREFVLRALVAHLRSEHGG